MTLSMYQASIPVFIRGFENLISILKKAEGHAEEKKIDTNAFIQARLFPDMFPLVRQVQIATDVVKGGMARLAGAEVPSYPDTETTFPELLARIEKLIGYLKAFKPEQIDGSEDRTISLKVGGQEMNLQGQPYLLDFIIPNFYFHLTTTYALLRHNGVEIGKKDFLGSL
jgi:hypothetical protein